MTIRYENLWPLTGPARAGVHEVYVSQFRDNMYGVLEQLQRRHHASCFIAWDGDEVVGFKMGSGLGKSYANTMGAVHPQTSDASSGELIGGVDR